MGAAFLSGLGTIVIRGALYGGQFLSRILDFRQAMYNLIVGQLNLDYSKH